MATEADRRLDLEMSFVLITAVLGAAVIVCSIVFAVRKKKMGAAIAGTLVGVLLAVFSRPIEIGWDKLLGRESPTETSTTASHTRAGGTAAGILPTDPARTQPPPTQARPSDDRLTCSPADCRSSGHGLQVGGKLPAQSSPVVIFVLGDDRKWLAQGEAKRASDGSWKASVGLGPAKSTANRDLPHRICLYTGTQAAMSALQPMMAANTPMDNVPSGWRELVCTDAIRPKGT